MASGDVLERTVITAPQAGKITGLQFHTLGGVVAPGATIMDIVPQNDKLIVEARVKPEDIDIVVTVYS
jgi:multidrug resistance efflux pump